MGLLERLGFGRKAASTETIVIPAPAPLPFDEEAHNRNMARIEYNISMHWDDERLEAERRRRMAVADGPQSGGRVLTDTLRIIDNIQRRRASTGADRPPLLYIRS